MTGAGAASLSFGKESTFLGSVTDDDSSGNPSFYQFGRNPTVPNLSLDNQLQRMKEAGVIESVEAVKQNFEGAFGVEATVNANVHDQVKKIVFNDGGGGFATGAAQSAEIRAGAEYLDKATSGTSTEVRALKGFVPTSYEESYEQGGMVTFSLTGLYGDEQESTEPTDLTKPTGGNDAAFHNYSLDIDGATVTKLQSATLSFENLYRFHYGSASSTPVDAVLASPETTLDVEAIYDTDKRTELAYGSAGATSPSDRLNSVSASVDVTVGGTTVSTYTLPQIKPATHDWSSLVDDETDLTDPTTFFVSGGVSVA